MSGHENLGFPAGFAVEIHAMTEESDGSFRTAQADELVTEFSVLAKEYHTDGAVTVHFDEDFLTYEAAVEAAQPWAAKWGVEPEDIGG